MALITRTYTFTDGTTAYGSQVEVEIANLVNTLNSLDTTSLKWDQVSILNATNVPLTADNGSGSQDIADFKANGTKKAFIDSAGNLNLANTTNQIKFGTTNIVTISSTAPVASRTYTIPDTAANSNFVMSDLAQTINGVKTFAGQLIGKGTTTNDSAASGYIGEYVSSSLSDASAISSGSNGQYADITSISLTAGDWLIAAQSGIKANGATITGFEGGVSTTSGNSGTGMVYGDNLLQISYTGAGAFYGGTTIAQWRLSLTSTTITYLKALVFFSAGTPKIFGRIAATRVR